MKNAINIILSPLPLVARRLRPIVIIPYVKRLRFLMTSRPIHVSGTPPTGRSRTLVGIRGLARIICPSIYYMSILCCSRYCRRGSHMRSPRAGPWQRRPCYRHGLLFLRPYLGPKPRVSRIAPKGWLMYSMPAIAPGVLER